MQNIPCKLVVHNIRNIVATGYIMKTPSNNVHEKKMSSELARFFIEVAIKETARLPFPNLNENLTLVGEAVEVPLMWPKCLIVQTGKVIYYIRLLSLNITINNYFDINLT